MRNFLNYLLYFWETSPIGTPTLTFLIFVFVLYVIEKLYFTRLTHTGAPGSSIHKLEHVLIENIEDQVEELAKEISKQNVFVSSNSVDEVEKLDDAVKKVILTSSEITESLYNFLSAFHASYGDIPDSNEITQYRMCMNSIPNSGDTDIDEIDKNMSNLLDDGGEQVRCDSQDRDFSGNDLDYDESQSWTTNNNPVNQLQCDVDRQIGIVDKLESMDTYIARSSNSNIYSDLI